MKILYLDPFAQTSADIIFSSLLDLDIKKDEILSEVYRLSIIDEYDINIRKVDVMSTLCTRVDVSFSQNHKRRSFSEVKEVIERSAFSERIKNIVLFALSVINDSCKRVNNAEFIFDTQNFSDTLIDIIGCVAAVDIINPDFVYASPIKLSDSSSEDDILKDIINTRGIKSEIICSKSSLASVCGAAILSSFVMDYSSFLEADIIKTGYGAGLEIFSGQNIARACIGTHEDSFRDSIFKSEIFFEEYASISYIGG